MAGDHSNHRRRVLRGAVVALVAVPAFIAALAAPSGAQTPPPAIPPDANFALVGVTTAGTPLAAGAIVNGDLAYCTNANGLGSELYFSAASSDGVAIRHATVSPMVIPLHIGVVSISDPTGEEPIQDDFVTLGVVDGSPTAFGSVGPSSATYGGLVVARSGIGVMAFDYSSTDSDCTQSRVMPILEPIIGRSATPEAAATAPAPTAPAAPTTAAPSSTTSTTTSSTTTTTSTTTSSSTTTTTTVAP